MSTYQQLAVADGHTQPPSPTTSDRDSEDDGVPSGEVRHDPKLPSFSPNASLLLPQLSSHPLRHPLVVLLIAAFVLGISVALIYPAVWTDVRGLLLRSLLSPQDCAVLTANGLLGPLSQNSTNSTADSTSLSSSSSKGNYTIVAPWADRWPVPDDELRCVVITLWGGAKASLAEEFANGWKPNEQYFFAPFKKHTDYVIFYTVWPHSAHQQLTDFARGWNWQLQEGDARSIIPFVKRRGNFTLKSEGDEYLSPLGVRVLFFPIIGGFPEWLETDAGLLERRDWQFCAKQQWGIPYLLYSGSMFNYQILAHPLLSAYDYYMKMDLDIRFNKEPPMSPFILMQQRQCVMFHTQWMPEHAFHDEDCNAESDLSALEWAAQHNITPSALGRGWFHGTKGYIYGNLVAGWLGFLRSPENLSLLRHLQDSSRYPGYWQHRWGDQPGYALMLGMWYNITDDEARGQVRTQHICDLIQWRYDSVFDHY